ncbi:hypothetical protein CEW88_00855 [Alloyangia pacifica]|uniref:Uncharacterized protein n=2 Tax=Alloyangia TaxID=2919626 RepID=A0A2U8H8W6_9RHOB|nr:MULTISPECIES: hypothetical protein [Roseobacteraceae]AWI82342.1 hypothetical protein CEW88_00855 [Alloyangia pacifica]MCA0940242.1 hypothetical protein [Alloyangia pacifica]MCA0945361.1 hypothetical protein [Alloyangia pacifica]MCT4369775.1 hypothetical protein [Alloyangia mangrovi]NDV49958.1 hypothetical protein [Salipiger sp. PrR003]
MNAMQINEAAQALYRAHGARAEAEAAAKVRENERRGAAEEAQTWRAIQEAIRQTRGPLQS